MSTLLAPSRPISLDEDPGTEHPLSAFNLGPEGPRVEYKKRNRDPEIREVPFVGVGVLGVLVPEGPGGSSGFHWYPPLLCRRKH